MKFANLRIGTRLALGFGLLGALLVVMAAVSITMLARMNDGTDHIANDRVPKIELANAFLNDIDDVAIALRNMMLNENPADRERETELILKTRKEVAANLQTFDKTLYLPKAREILGRTVAINDQYIKRTDEMLKLISTGTPEESKAYLAGQLRPLLTAYKGVIAEQIQLQTTATRDAAVAAEQTYVDTRNLMLVLGFGILAIAAWLGFWITRSITRPVFKALSVASTVAAGDLTSTINIESTDEMGQLLQALKGMNDSLAATVGTVRSGTETIASASGQVAAGSQDLSSRTEQQASSLEETASSMEELTSTVKQNADNARQANVLALAASTVAQRGGDVIAQVVETMGEINSSSTKIADIIGVIDGIAFQTNILALNAAVEAARAGEQGRGFAVVASEVRNLAQRSAAAAKEIKGLITDSSEKVANGSNLVHQAGGTMSELVESVRRVTDIMAEITAASAEQTAGIEQINQALTQMDDVTQQNAALVEEAAAAAEAMQDQAVKLAHAVSVFKLPPGAIGAAPAVAKAPPARSSAPVKGRLAPVRPTLPAAKPAPKRSEPAKATESSDWEEF